MDVSWVADSRQDPVTEPRLSRAKGLYNADNTTIIKKSDENPLVLELYNGLLKGKEHHLLHNESY